MKTVALISLIALAACAAPSMTRMADMSDERLCQTAERWPLRADVATMVVNRGLSCHPVETACAAAGVRPGEPGYRQCVDTIVAQMQADAAANRAAAAYLLQPGSAFNPFRVKHSYGY